MADLGGGEPLFNSGLAYLERIDGLFRGLHDGMARSPRTVQHLVPLLDSLCIEIMWRIKLDAERKALEQKIENTRNAPNYKNLLCAFKYASEMAHKYKLIMPDKVTISETMGKM